MEKFVRPALARIALCFAAMLALPALSAPQLLLPYDGVVLKSSASSAPGTHSAGTRVKFNLDALRTLNPGDEVALALPDGSTRTVVFELLQDHGNGIASWIGYMKETPDKLRVVITTGPGGSYGNISTPDGDYRLMPGDGFDWLVDMVAEEPYLPAINLREDARAIPQGVIAKAAAARLNDPTYIQPIAGVNSIAVTKTTPSMVQVDVMIAYTTGLQAALGANLMTRINNLIANSNTYLAASEVGIQLRLVGTVAVNYSDATDDGTALDDITPAAGGGGGVFANIETLRAQYGADMVSLLRNGGALGGSGIGWVPTGPMSSAFAGYMYTVITGCTAGCDWVFTHELGHNMGNQHDRATTAWQNGGAVPQGSYSYSYGYYSCAGGPTALTCNAFGGLCGSQPECNTPTGSTNNFADIMAYFHNSTTRNLKFSNPNLTCIGATGPAQPCGVSESLASSANAALSMNNNRTALSALFATTVGTAASTTTLASSLNPSGSGVAVTFTATVSGASGTPTGTVQFRANGAAITGCSAVTLSGGGATCTTSALASGTPSITAVYSGNTTYMSSTSAALTQTVRQPPTVGLTFTRASPAYGQSVTFTTAVTGSSGTPTGTVDFRANGTSLAGCSAVALASGVATCTTSVLPVMMNSVVAQYSGNYGSGTSGIVSVPVYGNATITLTASANPTTAGAPVSFTATFTAPSGTPTGAVTFLIDGSVIPGCGNLGVVSARAVCNTALVVLGPHTITANYTGDANFYSGGGTPFSETVVAPTSSPVALTFTRASPAYGQSITFTATVTGSGATATGTVDFRANGASISGCSAVALVSAVATCTTSALPVMINSLVAQYSGNATYGATASPSVQVPVYGTATIVITSSANPTTAGAPVTFTATFSAPSGVPTGAVSFGIDGSTISGCGSAGIASAKAVCTTTLTAPGPHTITAAYTGDALFYSGSATPFSETVGASAGTSTVALTFTRASPAYGQTITFTTTVSGSAGTPTGTVNFRANGTSLAGCSAVALVSGVATCTTSALPVMTNTVVAQYSGNASYGAASSAGVPVPVYGNATITVTSSANPTTVGAPVAYTATFSAPSGMPTGAVTFRIDGGVIPGCAGLGFASATVTCNTALVVLGPHSITVDYTGDANFYSGTSAPLGATVIASGGGGGSATAALTFTRASPAYGQAVTFTTTVSGSSGTPTGTVDFRANGASISGCSAVALASGVATCMTSSLPVMTNALVAQYSGNASYGSSASPGVSVPVYGNATIVVSASANPTSAGAPVAYTATFSAPSGVPTGTVTFFIDGTVIPGCGNVGIASANAVCNTALVVQGPHSITASYTGDAYFYPGTSAPLSVSVP